MGKSRVDKTLLVAEGTFDNAGPHVGGVAAGMSAALIAGVIILNLPLPGWLSVILIIAVLLGLAVLKARFGPPEMRLEKFDDEPVARVAGRFANASVPDRQSRDVKQAVIDESGDLRIELADPGDPDCLWLRQPAFSHTSLRMLADVIDDLHKLPREEVHSKYNKSYNDLNIYDAKSMLLIRLTQRPSYMIMMWLVSALTVVVWLLLLPVIVPLFLD